MGKILFTLDRIIKKRGLEQLSYRELAAKIGVSHGPIHLMATNALRAGKPYNPSVEMLEKLCEFFKCQPGDLMRYKN